jgi:hypothetical protein
MFTSFVVAHQSQQLSTIIRVRPSLTDGSRLRGARPQAVIRRHRRKGSSVRSLNQLLASRYTAPRGTCCVMRDTTAVLHLKSTPQPSEGACHAHSDING